MSESSSETRMPQQITAEMKVQDLPRSPFARMCNEPRQFVTIDCGEEHGPHHLDQCLTCGVVDPDFSEWACPLR